MGKVDQGVFTHWMLSHHFGRDLSYIGYGGSGKQVRDLLHVDDLVDLVEEQLGAPEHWSGKAYNVGGGRDGSLSLLETTAICRELTGNDVNITPVSETRAGDVRCYLSDCTALYAHTDWRPRRGPREVLADIHAWLSEHEELVRTALV
jgi:CDP-paratose 2-epimerase